MICRHCGEEISTLNLRVFDHYGSTYRLETPVIETEGKVSLRTDEQWCGESACQEDALKTITCPKCGNSPFGKAQLMCVRELIINHD